MTIKIVADMFIGIGEISLHSTRSLDDEKITIASSDYSFDDDYDDCSFSSTGYNDDEDENDDSTDTWDVSACVGEDSVMLAKNRGIRPSQYSKTFGNAKSATTVALSSPSTPPPSTKDQSTSSTDKTKSKTTTEESQIVYNDFVVDFEDADLHEAFDCSEQDSVKLTSRRKRGGRINSNSSHSCQKEQRTRKNYSVLIDEIGDDVDYEDELVLPLNDEL